MKKIDLHTHTIKTVSDYEFEFSLEILKEYVLKLELDAIAITNHNIFDLNQYNLIRKELGIKVFPGIEIDLEGGHLLVITEDEEFEIVDFDARCKKVTPLIQAKDDSITLSQFHSFFNDLGKYLLIPHYDKSPEIKPHIIDSLSSHITTGEVSSVGKFVRAMKDNKAPVPVLFSDVRFRKDLNSFPTRQTFVDLEDITIKGLKNCFFDKNKVALSKEDGYKFFQATDDGLMLSTGLNIILGERSSGKTFTMEKIASSSSNVKFIEQFSLLGKDEDKFNAKNKARQSLIERSFLNEFREVVEDIINIDPTENERQMEDFVESLKKHASESERKDLFAKCSLFDESIFQESNLGSLKKLIQSLITILDNTEYKDVITKHLEIQSIKSLLLELSDKALNLSIENNKKKWLNTIIQDIQRDLKHRTTGTFVENIDLFEIGMNIQRLEKFNNLVSLIKEERNIHVETIGKFRVITKSKLIDSAATMKAIGLNKQRQYSSVLPSYKGAPIDYIKKLKEIGIEEADIHKFFTNIESKTYNRDGFEVSGGERSEFNLIHEIQDAYKFDLLLIDEPESSFDNLFLKNEINTIIKEISKNIPVIVVTHNNTVGASIKPNFLVVTKKEIESREIKYRLYSGYPSDKVLKSIEGLEINNYSALLECLEAGSDAYDERNKYTYEILKN